MKLNEHELPEVCSLFGLGAGTEQNLAQRLLKKWDFRLVSITRGARESLLVSEDETVEHNGFSREDQGHHWGWRRVYSLPCS